MRKRGITLLLLIITIIVIIILAGTIIASLLNGNVMEHSKKARFMSDFRSVQEAVNLYSFSKYNNETGKFELPLKGFLSDADKTYIKDNVPTLNTKIEELSGPIDSVNLAWISSDDINVTLSNEKKQKGYIIDVSTGQIYDYIGDVFEGKRWHTLDGGVIDNASTGNVGDTYPEEVWDGFMKLTLFYPAGATDKKWRLGTEGEIRADSMLMWQDYTGPITVPLDRVKDVWIKYKLDNKEFTIPPAGTLLVDIVPDKTGGISAAKVTGDLESNALAAAITQISVTISFDESATVKEYRVGDSGWMTYTGPFTVTENCIVEARAKKTEYIYNTDGSYLSSRDVAGKDMVYIGNIGIEETELTAPTIARLPGIGEEKARVQIIYPAESDKKIYKVNYGVEENYTSEISIANYGTYIIAYYYDATGKRSQASSIRINDTSGGAPAAPPSPYDPNPPFHDGQPVPVPIPADSMVAAPTINVNPITLGEETQVSVSAPSNADKVYIKLGRYADYQEYTSAITVRQNMDVYAYYITYSGEKSSVANRTVSNIKLNNKPYVYINANPYPWSSSYGAAKVTVTISYSDTNTIEYSEDGIVFKPYTAPFDVTENKVIYARGINSYGVTETSLNITNIGKMSTLSPIERLSVGINVNPEPILSTDRVAKATVTIDYDAKATEKYYTIGRYGTLNTYTGAFEVTSNCTIFAYAKATNAQGQTYKTIDNVSTGIAEPTISTSPSGIKQASKVAVNITYDKYATIKRYSINGGTLKDYTGEFEVTTNASVIYAFSQNALGQKSEASYTIQNIVPEPPTLLLDKGSYYLLKLNYPEEAKTREYKWKTDGTWGNYKEAGILLIKPQFKDQLIKNGTLVKIEDETGKLVTFAGDYYLIDVPINELSGNIFMRWDREPLGAPQIIINPSEPAKQVTATIVYNNALVKKQYKIINPGETSGVWQDYTGPITIDRNNTIIFANGMDETEVWTPDATAKITNIDETAPVIKLTADLVVAQQKVGVKVNVTDDVAVGKVKWAAGTQGESYFASSGSEIVNDSIVNITSNGYYTFYAEDRVGNKQVYTLNITNVDLTPPKIDIAVTPETTVGLTSTVTINYGDATTKQYKVGTSNATWTNYTASFDISSYTILSNNWQNSDGTVTIYAKGKDSSGNEITVEKKVLSLDLDKPTSPVINSNAGYPTLTAGGVKYNAATTITFDARMDINNYYSIDTGTTWLPYTGQFDLASGTVIAKSVKKSTGLEVTVSKTIAMPADALKVAAYDNNDTTGMSGSGSYYIFVDSVMEGNKIRVKWYSYAYSNGYPVYLRFLNENNTEISSVTRNYGNFDDIYTVPLGTKKIKYESTSGSNNIYEIQPSNEPIFTTTNGYMLLTADTSKAIKEPYQMVTIKYFPTSIQRLYRIGSTGEWLNYNDQPVKVNSGLTIYAKGVDQYGNETRIISSLTVNVTDGLKAPAYDGNDTTAMGGSGIYYMDVDSSMVGSKIRVKWYSYAYSNGYPVYLRFLNENNAEISFVTRNYGAFDDIYTIPAGTKRIKYESTSSANNIYEIQPSNEPTFSTTNGYMLLIADTSKAIRNPNQMVSITYFATSVQRLYRIGATGDWLNYQDAPIRVDHGQTIYAKGIDRYGNETRIISSLTANSADGIKNPAYDNNDTTFTSESNVFMEVDSGMQGKNIRVRWKGGTYSGNPRVSNLIFTDSSKNEISRVSSPGGSTAGEGIYAIPANTKYIKYVPQLPGYSYDHALYEIQACNEPTFTATSGYMLLTVDTANAIRQPYQMVTINYFPTSVQRLYSIGSTSSWVSYQDSPVKVDQGQTLYAKGIDQYGNETRIVSSYVANVVDAIKNPAYDNNNATSMNESNTFMEVEPAMQGKNIRVRWRGGTYSGNYRVVYLIFTDASKNEISRITSPAGSTINEGVYAIPANTKYIKYVPALPGYSYDHALFEIQPSP